MNKWLNEAPYAGTIILGIWLLAQILEDYLR